MYDRYSMVQRFHKQTILTPWLADDLNLEIKAEVHPFPVLRLTRGRCEIHCS